MSFQLVSIPEKFGENEIITLYMTVNGKTFNCAFNKTSFDFAKTCEQTLVSAVTELTRHCFQKEKHCEYEDCAVQNYPHNHVDKNTVKFIEAKNAE